MTLIGSDYPHGLPPCSCVCRGRHRAHAQPFDGRNGSNPGRPGAGWAGRRCSFAHAKRLSVMPA
jgi:hypothetical protein